MAKEAVKDKLNPKQKEFCRIYASEQEFFGNGVQSYIKVYEPDQTKKFWYESACASASQLLSNIKVCEEINRLLEVGGLNDAAVDKQLSFLITQHSDFKSKATAIREYNKLKNRITDKLDLNLHLPKPILESVLSNDLNKENSEAN